ncbi:DUF3152 domain-containing protein [Actinokineospora sp. 24-640]
MTQGERDTSAISSPSAATTGEEPALATDDRYRPGTRRTSGEPLAASWHPEPPADRAGGRKPPRRGVRGFLTTYGWRIYAVPLLLAVTVLVLFQTAGERGPAGAGDGLNPAMSAPAEPVDPEQTEPAVPGITEKPGPVDLDIPSAELPAGPAFTKAGKATFRTVPGAGKKVGAGQLFTYTVDVEEGIDAAEYGGDETFAKLVDRTLADPRGWTSLGEVALQRVGPEHPDPTFRVSLTTPDTVHRPEMCLYSIKYEASCYRHSERRVLVNLARWVRGAVAFDGDMLTYRQYAINHEVGHAFRIGLQHVGCAKAGELAPVMMQQSFGVANNYVAQLNRAVGLNDQVKSDGLVCKPNAWPNPQAQPAN